MGAKIEINVNIEKDQNVNISHTGKDTNIITDNDMNSFKIGTDHLHRAVERFMGRRPDDVYHKSPTPWGDLYKRYGWQQVTRVLSVKSARVKNITRNPVQVLSHDSENSTNHTIKVNTGLSHTVENSVTTSWSTEDQNTFSYEVKVGIKVNILQARGKVGFSSTSIIGVSEVKTKHESIGTTSNVEIELKPGEAVRAVLMAIAGYVEIEVVHEAYLTGQLAVNYNPPHNGHHFHCVPIERALASLGINNKITMTQTIIINFFNEAKLRVYEKKKERLLMERS